MKNDEKGFNSNSKSLDSQKRKEDENSNLLENDSNVLVKSNREDKKQNDKSRKLSEAIDNISEKYIEECLESTGNVEKTKGLMVPKDMKEKTVKDEKAVNNESNLGDRQDTDSGNKLKNVSSKHGEKDVSTENRLNEISEKNDIDDEAKWNYNKKKTIGKLIAVAAGAMILLGMMEIYQNHLSKPQPENEIVEYGKNGNDSEKQESIGNISIEIPDEELSNKEKAGGEVPDGEIADGEPETAVETKKASAVGEGQSGSQEMVLDNEWSGKSVNLTEKTGDIGIQPEMVREQEEESEDVKKVNVSDNYKYGTAEFSIELFKRCLNGEKNVFISPLSAQIALAMTANGASGNTQSEMLNVLCRGMELEELNQNINEYTNKLAFDGSTKIKLADSIWIKESEDTNLPVEDIFLQNIMKYYHADVYKAPFDESTIGDMNKWISERTYGMISKAIRSISEYTVMYLINAIVFEGQWQEEYAGTVEGEFTSYNGIKRTVDVMKSTESYYIEDDNAAGFCKPYTSGYSFVAIMPDEGTDIKEYAANLTGGHFIDMIDNSFRRRNVEVRCTLPKFEIEGNYQIPEVLKDMGMTDSFDMEKADFSNLCKDEDWRLWIGNVIQKTYVNVDEKGTKAAAATIVESYGETAESMDEMMIYEVKLDRPFIFAIVDDNTKLPVFMGAVLELG